MVLIVWYSFAYTIYGTTLPQDNVDIKTSSHINNNNPYEVKQVHPTSDLTTASTEPVIFEPIRNIKLSRATYKVTSYINFEPYLHNFMKFNEYLQAFKTDLKDERKMGTLMDMNPKFLLEGNDRDCTQDMRNTFETLRCKFYRQYLRILKEVTIIEELFQSIHQKFLAAIDHLDYYPQYTNNTREKRFIHEGKYYPKRQYEELNKEESALLDTILNEIKRLHPEVHKELIRVKRFNLMTWIIGWGTWSNRRNIRKIKKNIKILHEQNILQEKQILELTHFLNLTMNQVREHKNALYDIDNRLMIVNKTLMTHIRVSLLSMTYHELIAVEARIVLARLNNGILSLQENVDKIYEYLRTMASHEVNPLVLPPESLRKVLKSIKEEMRQNPRLELPYDPDEDIWSYYSIMRVSPIILDDFLLVILTVPLVDQSLQMDVYKVHNLPALHPDLNIQFTYQLEGKYLAIGKHGLYAALPSESDIRICMTTSGGLCMMNQALYPVERIEWCIYALYIKDTLKISQYCMVETKVRHANLAVSLEGYMWAISSLATTKLHIRCLTDSYLEEITPPLKIIYIGNGCEGFSNTITIPAKSELTSTMDIPERTNFFLTFNEKYQKIETYGIWSHIKHETLTQEEIDELGIKLSEFPPMTLNHLKHRIQHLDDTYPWSMHPNILLAILLGSLVLGMVTVGYFLLKIYRMRSHLRSLKDLKNFFRGTADSTQLNELRAQLKTLIYPVDTHKLIPTPGPSTAMPKKSTTDRPPTPPQRPAHTKEELIPLEELPSSKSVDYAVKKLGFDVKGYRAFLQKHIPQRTASQK